MDGITRRSVLLAEATHHPAPARTAPPRLHVFSGATTADVLAALDSGHRTTAGSARLVVVADGDEQLAERTARARRHLEEGYPPGDGVHFRAEPVAGELAFVFTAAGAAYHGMGADLLRAVPEIIDPIGGRFPLGRVAGWVFDAASGPTPNDYLWGTAMLSQAHARLTRNVLGLKPSAAIGYSSGESNSLFAFDVWSDMDAMRREIDASGLMDRELGVEFRAVARAWGTGSAQWAMWNVLAPIAQVQDAIADEERVHLAIVNTGEDVVIGGDAAACERVVAAIGRTRCRPVDYNLACHVPEVAAAFHQPWVDIHTRAVTPMPGLRHYSNGARGAYAVSTASCAEMITRQAETTLDFPATIEAAYADGVRIFVEHGPGWRLHEVHPRDPARPRHRRRAHGPPGPRRRPGLRGGRGARRCRCRGRPRRPHRAADIPDHRSPHPRRTPADRSGAPGADPAAGSPPAGLRERRGSSFVPADGAGPAGATGRGATGQRSGSAGTAGSAPDAGRCPGAAGERRRVRRSGT